MKRFHTPGSGFRIAVVGLALAAMWLGGCALLGGKPPEPSVPVAMVPEMEPLPGFDRGTPCRPDEFAADAAKAAADWAAERPAIERLITPAKARELSRWARKEMQQYRRVPPLDTVAFRPVACHKDARHLVLEGDVDTLPSHSHLVTRWLKVYLLFDQDKQALVKVAVTIRGQLEE
ncbi:MAG TPA: hypothetical protein VNE39_00995 [Planctomycetota bacterium]|nr:hypothetical protein [Planctomycetota bacterium]